MRRVHVQLTGLTSMLHLFTDLEFHTGLMLVLALIFVLFMKPLMAFMIPQMR